MFLMVRVASYWGEGWTSTHETLFLQQRFGDAVVLSEPRPRCCWISPHGAAGAGRGRSLLLGNN